jgi:hypothetical protein
MKAGGELLAEPTAMQDQRLGLVLGRAVSYEIGHYLLQTSTHATRGLMRARIDAREFADLRSGTFRLDRAAEAHMATIAAPSPQRRFPASRIGRFTVFCYSPGVCSQ